MKPPDENNVAFFGKITAGFTHEIKNVLAIIQQASGLMEDIMSISPEAILSHQDKIQISLDRIKDQIKRGVELTNRLNKFAHSTDESTAKIDLYEMTEQLISLSARYARLKNVVLKAHPPDQPIAIVTHPLLLQRTLYECIECCLIVMTAGGKINIYSRKYDEKQEVYFLCEGDSLRETAFVNTISVSENWSILQEIAASLGGFAEMEESAPGILLTLPSEIK